MTGCQLFQCGFARQCNNISQQNHSKREADLAAKAFQSLSAEEQDEVYSDLYGYVESSIDETTEFVNEKLEELGKELDKLDGQVLKYYLRAIQQEEEELDAGNGEKEPYITSKKFLLMFLRAERFDCRKAAKKLTVYFKEKCDLFGEDKLACRIKQSDFSEQDMKTLFSGAFCFADDTDMAGRPIIVFRRQCMLEQSVTSMKRAYFYMFQSLLENNEAAQKNGIVVVVYNMNESIRMNPSKIRTSILPIPRMNMHVIPVWVASFHICYDDFRENLFLNFVLVVHPKHLRARFQQHFHRTHEECLFDLVTYGINPSTLPLSHDGSFRHDVLKEYLQLWRQLEEQSCS